MAKRRGFSALRDIPTVLWLVATVVVALAHTSVPVPRWLMIHLLLLGAVSHSILVWSQHFADALLRTRPPRHRLARMGVRLGLLNAGAVLVVGGVVLARWGVTVTGAAAIIVASGTHTALLVRQIRRSLPARFAPTVRFYVVAAVLLVLGAAIGAILARDISQALHERLQVAHVTLNVLGWIGMTVLGTLITLWPTVLGTRIEQGCAAMAIRALPVLTAGVVFAALGAVVNQRWWVTIGVVAYLVGVGMVARGLVSHAWRRPPVTYATLSIASGLLWGAGSLGVIAWASASAPTWTALAGTFDSVAPLLAAGFAAQVLVGALSFLIPAVLGGGPASARVSHREFDRGAQLRIVVINGGLAVWAVAVPAAVRVASSMAVLAAFAAFLVLLVRATRAWRLSREAAQGLVTPGSTGSGATPVTVPWHARPRGQRAGLAATGLAIVALVVAIGVALDPAPFAAAANAGPLDAAAVPTGRTVEVRVNAADMRFTPDTITVDPGDRLIVTVDNADATHVHDLVLDSGDTTARLVPGQIEVLDVGLVGRNAQGWCSVLGHRSMGMVLSIDVTG